MIVSFFISLTIYIEKVRENEQEANNKNQRESIETDCNGISEKNVERGL